VPDDAMLLSAGCSVESVFHASDAASRLTRIRREIPPLITSFFRPNPLAFESTAGKNAGHRSEFIGSGSPEQAEIARSGPGR